MKPSRFLAGLAAAGVLAVTPSALAWKFGIGIHMSVNQHEFQRVAVENDDCKLNIALHFDAPEKGYRDKSPRRNYHRFKARLLFKNGKEVTTEVFANDKPGKRVIRLEHDSAPDACWAKEKVELKDVDVVGCRAKGCKLESFARVTPQFSN